MSGVRWAKRTEQGGRGKIFKNMNYDGMVGDMTFRYKKTGSI